MFSVITNKAPIVSILIIVFAVTLIANSYGQVATVQTSKTEKVYLQIQVRNSDGKLVAYIEPTVLYVYYPGLLDKYLDKKPNISIVTIDGKRFEQIQFEERGTFDKYHTYAQYEMWSLNNGQRVDILSLLHDGYVVVPGDTYSVLWTIIRPAF